MGNITSNLTIFSLSQKDFFYQEQNISNISIHNEIPLDLDFDLYLVRVWCKAAVAGP